MPSGTVPARRTQKLDLRITPAAKLRLQMAADASRRSLSDFVVESALTNADHTLADRRMFELDKKKWVEFHAMLDAPVQELPRLRKLLSEPSAIERRRSR